MYHFTGELSLILLWGTMQARSYKVYIITFLLQLQRYPFNCLEVITIKVYVKDGNLDEAFAMLRRDEKRNRTNETHVDQMAHRSDRQRRNDKARRRKHK